MLVRLIVAAGRGLRQRPPLILIPPPGGRDAVQCSSQPGLLLPAQPQAIPRGLSTPMRPQLVRDLHRLMSCSNKCAASSRRYPRLTRPTAVKPPPSGHLMIPGRTATRDDHTGAP